MVFPNVFEKSTGTICETLSDVGSKYPVLVFKLLDNLLSNYQPQLHPESPLKVR